MVLRSSSLFLNGRHSSPASDANPATLGDAHTEYSLASAGALMPPPWNEFASSGLILCLRVVCIMNTPDQDTLVRAIEDARRILAEHVQLGPSEPERTLESLLSVLDKNEIVLALDRVSGRRVIRLTEPIR